MPEPTKIGLLLRNARNERDMTQQQVAVEIGVARSTVAGIETGSDLPGRETMFAMLDFFKVPLTLLAASADIDGSGALASTEDEALWMHAYRQIDEGERESLLRYVLSRAKPKSN